MPTIPDPEVCELCGGAEILPNLFSHEPTCPLYEIPEEEVDDDIIQE